MEKFKSIPELIQSLNHLAVRINKGSVGLEEFEVTLRDARELYERLVILRYKAIEDRNLMGGSAIPEVETKVQEEKASKPETVLKAKQISLIDSIEEIAREESPATAPETTSTPKVEHTEEREQVQTQLENHGTLFEEQKVTKKEETAPEPEQAPEPKQHPKPEVVATHQTNDLPDTLADKLGKTKIDDLTVAIGLNQKFRFINELFDGDSDAYNQAVKKLNQLPDKTAAQSLLQNELISTYSWDEENEVTLTFLNLVERRYQS